VIAAASSAHALIQKAHELAMIRAVMRINGMVLMGLFS
jgi:hypothetical protein